ncbi:hypothetical protein BLNAU_11737 [Blattamonas nauphoetae]|uniref:Uncharacterized protein n=1 Tax=Blattamonas nauphoetae TaxID=2049346 RepID=A0ABQ9XQX4_9EUKA|nr:hypothetical protein BLNAU_11737 [Blattamonas nauphoetae]
MEPSNSTIEDGMPFEPRVCFLRPRMIISLLGTGGGLTMICVCLASWWHIFRSTSNVRLDCLLPRFLRLVVETSTLPSSPPSNTMRSLSHHLPHDLSKLREPKKMKRPSIFVDRTENGPNIASNQLIQLMKDDCCFSTQADWMAGMDALRLSAGHEIGSVSSFSFSMDCSAFLNWDEEDFETDSERFVVFRSLVATVKLQSALDASLEENAVKFLKSVNLFPRELTRTLLSYHGRITDESLTDFIQSIVVLLSSTSQAITTASMEILESLIFWCSSEVRLALVQADLIPQLIITLNPLSLSFAEAEDFHTDLISNISRSLWLATPDGLADLKFEGYDEQQDVHESILKQVLAPSEKYIWHLCVNRYSIKDGEQSRWFLDLLAQLLRICPYYQPTMDFVFDMPVFLTIPSCLAFIENDHSIWHFLNVMMDTQHKWNKKRGEVRQMWKTVHQMLRMEGIEDASEGRLRNDRNGTWGGDILDKSISWSNTHDMNLPRRAYLPRRLPPSPPTLFPPSLRILDLPCSSTDPYSDDSDGSEGVVARSMGVLDSSSDAIHTLSLPSASPLTSLIPAHIDDCRSKHSQHPHRLSPFFAFFESSSRPPLFPPPLLQTQCDHSAITSLMTCQN